MTESMQFFDAGGPVAYREWRGPSGLTFVCVHSLLGSSADWGEVAQGMSHLGRVLAVDLPGFGSSPLSGRRPSTGTYAEVLSRFLAETVDGPVILMGTSLGGLVVAAVAAHHDPAVVGVVLGSSYLPPYFAGWRAPGVIAGLILEKVSLLGTVIRSRLIRTALPELPPDGFSPSERSPTDTSASTPERWAAAARLIAEMSVLAAIPGKAERLYDRITCPVLVLHGGEDNLVPVEWAYRAARRRANWRIETRPAVAHVVKAGPTQWWTATVEDWLAALGRAKNQPTVDDTATPRLGPR